MCVYVRLCQCMCETYYFSLACSSRWQPNYHFQRYTDIQIENCTQERGSFLSGWWFMGVCVGRYFLPFFFSRLCFSTVSSIVSYLHRRCHQEEERKWMEEGGKMVRSVTSLKKCSSSGLSQAKLLLLQNVCIVKALLTTKNLRCWLFLVYFSAYSPPMTNEF